jgi:hypothetical protein
MSNAISNILLKTSFLSFTFRKPYMKENEAHIIEKLFSTCYF